MDALDASARRDGGSHGFRRGCRLLALVAGLRAASVASAADAAAAPAAGPAASANPTAVSPLAAGEYQLKAVFLFNFTKYVEWPAAAVPDAQAPFVIGVFGDDPFGSVLDDTVRGEKVGGRPLFIRRYATEGEIKDCQILFISQSEAPQLEQIVAGLKGRSVLTVGDFDKFTDGGGMIWLVTENSKIRMKINLEAAKAAGLTISSNLLRAAEVAGHAKD
jgi:hypothetical protein